MLCKDGKYYCAYIVTDTEMTLCVVPRTPLQNELVGCYMDMIHSRIHISQSCFKLMEITLWKCCIVDCATLDKYHSLPIASHTGMSCAVVYEALTATQSAQLSRTRMFHPPPVNSTIFPKQALVGH